MDKAFYLGFLVLNISNILLYENYYDKLQPCFGEKNLHLQYMDTDSFILSVNRKDIIKDFKNLEDIFDFSNLDKNHDFFSKKKRETCGQIQIRNS